MMVSDLWLKLFDISVITQLQEHFVCGERHLCNII